MLSNMILAEENIFHISSKGISNNVILQTILCHMPGFTDFFHIS